MPLHDEPPPHDVSVADEFARRALKNMQTRVESLERKVDIRHEQVSRMVSSVRDEVRIGFSLMGYDVQKAAAQRAAGMADPATTERDVPEPMREREASHPVLEKLEDAADKLTEGAERLFDAAEAHTKPDIAQARQSDSERVRDAEAKAVGKRVLSIREGLIVDGIKVLIFGAVGYIVHWIVTLQHGAPAAH